MKNSVWKRIVFHLALDSSRSVDALQNFFGKNYIVKPKISNPILFFPIPVSQFSNYVDAKHGVTLRNSIPWFLFYFILFRCSVIRGGKKNFVFNLLIYRELPLCIYYQVQFTPETISLSRTFRIAESVAIARS